MPLRGLDIRRPSASYGVVAAHETPTSFPYFYLYGVTGILMGGFNPHFSPRQGADGSGERGCAIDGDSHDNRTLSASDAGNPNHCNTDANNQFVSSPYKSTVTLPLVATDTFSTFSRDFLTSAFSTNSC